MFQLAKTNNCEQGEETAEKRKNGVNIIKKHTKNTKKRQINAEEESELEIYIKVLFTAQKTLPNVINVLDKLIEKRASTFIPASTIYGSSNSTYNEVDHIIDLGNRKEKLLNLYVICNDLINSLNEDDRKLITLKYVKNYSSNEISQILTISERTIFRRCNSIIKKLAIHMINMGWGLKFIQSQIGKEPWLEQIYNKKKKDEAANIVRSSANKK